MDPTPVESLLDLARRDAPRTLAEGEEWLRRLGETDWALRAGVLRAMTIASRFSAGMEDSIGYGRRAVAAAEDSGDRTLQAETLTTLAGSLAMAGEIEAALEALTAAAVRADTTTQALIEFQRGAIYSSLGEFAAALEAYSAALPIFAAAGDGVQVAITLHNRGLVHVLGGDYEAAEQDLLAAREHHIRNGLDHLLSGAEHNLGVLAAHRGEVGEALRRFAASEELERAQTGSAVPVHASRCEVLMSVGLFREALHLATRIYREHQRQGRGEDEAEARLVAAQAALFASDLQLAATLSGSAAEMFQAQGRPRWAAAARRVGVQARLESGAVDTGLLSEAVEVAARLEGGLTIPAQSAALLAGLVALELGEPDVAERYLARVAAADVGPVELRLQAHLARARSRLAGGDRRGADAAARSGFRLLDRYQLALGATDVRAGVERHASSLGSIGLRLAIEAGGPRRVLGWMERSRANSLRFRPTSPPDDEGQARDLARLRRLLAELRRAEEPDDGGLIRQIRSIQDSIKQRARLTSGSGSVEAISVEELAEELAGYVLTEFAAVEGRLWAVVMVRSRCRLVDLGPVARILGEMEGLRLGLRRAARTRRSGSLRKLVESLDRLLLESLPLHEGPVLVVPTPALYAAPWSMLPSLSTRQVVVAPSAASWVRAHRSLPSGRGVLVAAGPDLSQATAEVDEVARLYPRARRVTGEDATVTAVSEAMAHSAIAHLACHARFEAENPMFSSLRLSDGDLFVYDIEQLVAPPDLVVLSACDSGFTETHPGDELLGLSAALIRMGSRTVIASVGLVPDAAATKDLMVDLHRRLRAGITPSLALHQAQSEAEQDEEGYVAAASFVCIGAG